MLGQSNFSVWVILLLLFQHWRPRGLIRMASSSIGSLAAISWMASCVKSADCYDFAKIQIFTWSSPCSLSSEFVDCFDRDLTSLSRILQVTNLGKTFLKKGRGISVLRFAQLWDCVSFEIHTLFGGVPKKHREHHGAPWAPCVVKGEERCYGAFSLKRMSTDCSSQPIIILCIANNGKEGCSQET